MTASNIFLDTAPVIYFLEKDPNFYDAVARFFSDNGTAAFVTSTVTVAECFPGVYRNNPALKDDFDEFIENMDISILDINRRIAEKSAKIRVDYPAFKGMDSLQLAAATVYGCDLFLTNDKQLRQFKEINCVTVSVSYLFSKLNRYVRHQGLSH